MLSPTADFIDFFIRLPSTALTFSKKTPPTKTIGKPQVFTGFLHFGVCAHGSKIIGKSLPTRFSSKSRHRDLSKHIIFEFQNAKIVPEVSRGRLGRPPAAPLGPFWPPTWPPWRALGRSLAAWGPLLGALGSLLATLLLANS